MRLLLDEDEDDVDEGVDVADEFVDERGGVVVTVDGIIFKPLNEDDDDDDELNEGDDDVDDEEDELIGPSLDFQDDNLDESVNIYIKFSFVQNYQFKVC